MRTSTLRDIETRQYLLTWVPLPEHHVLYQVNIHNAKNVFIGLQEGESAYWQGTGNKLLAPEPWTKSLLPSDPDFSWCAPDSAMVCFLFLFSVPFPFPYPSIPSSIKKKTSTPLKKSPTQIPRPTLPMEVINES